MNLTLILKIKTIGGNFSKFPLFTLTEKLGNTMQRSIIR